MSLDEERLRAARRLAGLDQIRRDLDDLEPDPDARGEWDYPDDGNAIRGIIVAATIIVAGWLLGYAAYRLGVIASVAEAVTLLLIIGACILYGTRRPY